MLSIKNTRYIFPVICLLICMAFMGPVTIAVDPPVVRILNGSTGQLKVDSLMMVEDAKFFSGNTNLIRPYRVENMVSLEVNEDALIPIQDSFTVTARLQIKKTDALLQVSTQNIDLTVNYSKDSSYKQRRTFYFSNAFRVEVKVISLSKSVAWDAYALCKVVNQLQSHPAYRFDCDTNAVKAVTANTFSVEDELPVSWGHMDGADEYDLEWAYVDLVALNDSMYGIPTSPDPKLLFAGNASRVTVSGTSYRIPLYYDRKGKLFFRVRSVHWASALGAQGSRIEAKWSSGYPGGLGAYEFNGHEKQLNWQSSTSFAEDGKRKTVMQYYDGSLRARQTVTKDNVSDKTIVAESLYDFQGRPVIQVMPAPTLNNVIRYARGLNRTTGNEEYEKRLFDTLPDPAKYCETQAIPMSSDSGASRYYSPRNSFLNSGDLKYRFVPDAELYPFSEVEYAQDNTGRITRQSGVGIDFRMGSGHETYYSYGTPDQRELDALFGTEVGLATHYQKVVVRDANGQTSISYTDMRGRTIATALAGSLPAGARMDTLSSMKRDTRTETLADPSTAVIRDLIMESKKGLEVTEEDSVLHSFEYKLSPESIQAGCSTQFCYDCLYDLEIIITSDCNNCRLPGKQAFYSLTRNFSFGNIDTTCNPAQEFIVKFDLWLKKGSYEITKKLSVNKTAMDYYRDSLFMSRNNCKTEELFANNYRNKQVVSNNCLPACDGCLLSVGTWQVYWNNYKQKYNIAAADTVAQKDLAMRAHKEAVDACNALCGNNTEKDAIRSAMLADLTPPMGQYADINRDDNKYSIFFIDSVTTPRYQLISNYKDASGMPALVYRESTGKMVSPQQLSPDEFIENFQSSWAEALLPKHPEYSLLEKYSLLDSSHQWDRDAEAISTYALAKQRGYMNPTGATISPFSYFAGTGPDVVRDPFSNYNGRMFRFAIEDIIERFQDMAPGPDASLYGLAAISILCTDNQQSCIQANASGLHLANSLSICDADRDIAWQVFRATYLSWKKQKIFQWVRTGSSAPSALELRNNGYASHFVFDELFDNNGLPRTVSGMTAANNHKASAEQKAKNYYDSNCVAYVNYWIKTLSASCALYDTLDLRQNVMPLLVAVCQQGADIDHPFGSSTVKPSSIYAYRSFEEVIAAYNRKKGIRNNNCNAYVITAPAPYDQQVAPSDKPLAQKPADCECDLILKFQQQFVNRGSEYGTFGRFMREVYKTDITDSIADYLTGICNNSPSCTYLSGNILLPPVFQCNTGDVCIDCSLFNRIDSCFRAGFPDVLPSSDPAVRSDSVQQSWNRLYENYMNHKTGFAKSAADYLAFARQCQGSSRSFGCDSLNRILLAYRQVRKTSFGVRYQRSYTSVDGSRVTLTDPADLVKDGMMMFPDSVRAGTLRSYNGDAISAVNFQPFCFPQGYAYEFRFKLLKPEPKGDLFYSIAGSFGATFSLTVQGLKLIMVANPELGVTFPVNVVADPDTTIVNGWCTVKCKTTISNVYIYFNGKLIYTGSRNPVTPIPNFQIIGASFYSRQAAIDWYKLYDHNDSLKYFEYFNSLAGYSIPAPSPFCAPVTDCKTHFVSFFNQRNGNSNFNYQQIEEIYKQTCGRLPDPCYEVDSLMNTLKRFNKSENPSKAVPSIVAPGMAAPDSLANDPERTFRDGAFMWESRFQAKNTNSEYTYHRIAAPAGTLLCTDQNFSVEGRFRAVSDVWGTTADLFYYDHPGIGRYVVCRQSGGLYIRLVTLTDGTSDVNFTPMILLTGVGAAITDWNNYKVTFAPDSVRFYFNDIKKGAVRNPRNGMALTNHFQWMVNSYKGSLDWVKVHNSKGKPVYYEDFNDPNKPAGFDPTFICSALADCQTSFVNYFNQQRNTSYAFRQIDSLYYHRTGRSLDVCGIRDSLMNVMGRYNANENPNRLILTQHFNDPATIWENSQYANNRNAELIVGNGLFRHPDTLQNISYGTGWKGFRLSASTAFCANREYTLEVKMKVFRDIWGNEEIFYFDDGNVQFKFDKRTGSATLNGINLTSVLARNPSNPATRVNILASTVNMNSNPSQLVQEWVTVKFNITPTRIRLYWNDVLKLDQTRTNTGFQPASSLDLYFNSLQGALDYVKVYNSKGQIYFSEDFEDQQRRALVDPAFLCPKATADCKTPFLTYFNQQRGTSYTFDQIDSLHFAMTGTSLNICGDRPMSEPYFYTLCGRATPGYPAVAVDPINNCTDSTFFIDSYAQTRYRYYADSLRGNFDSAYRAKCLNAYKFEKFTVRRSVQEYHYTLYYYDQAGNLVKTVPPAGVRPVRDSIWLDNVKIARANKQELVPGHELPTDYRYNALNQVVSQKSPDGGASRFWYDRLGRLVVSQNAKQRYASSNEENRLYSYTKYDSLGRIKEVGQLRNLLSNGVMHDTTSRNPELLSIWMTALNQRREQITSTVYDLPYPGFTEVVDNRQIVKQRNLRNRVSYTTYTDSWNTANYNQGTFYTYDIHGNVDTLLQDFGCGTCGNSEVNNLMNQNGNRFKKIFYNYDLISGKVNGVAYQRGWSDQFFHRYSYDGENRLTLTETSIDGKVWERDARYEYYLHGPLARTVLGAQHVQGIDYAYTLQGWLKGVNSAGALSAYDMGGDGDTRTGAANRYVARDAYGFALNYFANDYKAIVDTLKSFPGYSAYLNTDFRPLYNGNISSMVSTNRVFENPAAYPDSATLLFNYTYDQLNRITGMDVFNKFNRTANNYNSLVKIDKFRERVSYDGNGNILKYLRNGNGNGATVRMDSLRYSYYPGTNRLKHVRDSVPANWYGAGVTDKIIDIDNQSDPENYIYDSIGNLIKDKAEKITNIGWNVYGKITSISKAENSPQPASEIRYTYDASGNRISKSVEKSGRKNITWYVRDAQGNVMATYTGEDEVAKPLPGFAIVESERYIYGSSRLGVTSLDQPVDNGNAGPASVTGDTGSVGVRGERMYELSNHLGNVLTTITDRKFGVSSNGSLIDYYEPVMLSGTDYYAFGSLMRSAGDKAYRYGFNGKENDNEVKGGDGLQQDYGFRVYDNRLGRFLSVDPITADYPELTPYQFASNSPIANIDIDGLEGEYNLGGTNEMLKRKGDALLIQPKKEQVAPVNQQAAGLNLGPLKLKKDSYEGTSWFWPTGKATVFAGNSIKSGYNQLLGGLESGSKLFTKKGRSQIVGNALRGFINFIEWSYETSDDEKLDFLYEVATDVNTYEDIVGGYLLTKSTNFRFGKTSSQVPLSPSLGGGMPYKYQFQFGKCVEFAEEFKKRMAKGIKLAGGQIQEYEINIGPNGLIGTSKVQLANNGMHRFVEAKIGNEIMIFDNYHPQGISKQDYLKEIGGYINGRVIEGADLLKNAKKIE
ncbi:MAG: RHS repeat-associated core domain-containing protein [Pseudobacter sp.]|uniref:RHS repeat-associated core domain-containing protein n=1 Tax=Pseudobacter sp. TaxID=2045420 RepID=UPI003F7E2734